MIFKRAQPPLESAILMIGGLALIIAGLLLFPAQYGKLGFYENGFHGLLLIIFALQMLTLGKTPFGEARRTWFLSAAAMAIAVAGMLACFIPVSTNIPRFLLVLCFGLGGLIRLFGLFLGGNKLRTWMDYGGIFKHLSVGCVAVYALSIFLGIALLLPETAFPHSMAVDIFLLGAAVIYLALVLWKIYHAHPDAERKVAADKGLSFEHAMLMLMGVFLLLLGALLIPVNLGLLPFAPHAQLGLLMVVFAIQMLAAGNTPIGVFPRTWAMLCFGFVFAGFGIVSCLVPEMLVAFLTVAVGALNILGGIVALATMWFRRPGGRERARNGKTPAILVKLGFAQLFVNLLAILFGTSMLVPSLVPGSALGVILAANGGVLLYLLRILEELGKVREKMARSI